MKKVTLGIFFNLFLIFSLSACANTEKNNSSEKERATSSTSEEVISSLNIYPDEGEWYLGKMDINGLVEASAGDQTKAISDANLVINLSLGNYFKSDQFKDSIVLSSDTKNPDFYSLAITNSNIENEGTMDTIVNNFETLVNKKPINPEIDVYLLTALYSTNATVENNEPSVISYILSDDGTLKKVE